MMQSSMNATKQPHLVLEKQPFFLFFSYTKFPVKRNKCWEILKL
jgi:hypothetical protein